MTKRILRPQWCLLVVFAVLAMDLGLASPAAAQGFLSFLWGGGSREVVAFHPAHPAGQIIVSFGDRRLYWVQRRGEAISYPIAIPREKSRWQGVTSVSDKRVNPDWTPTAEMRREIRGFRRMSPAGPAQSSGRARALSRLQHVPDPRHRCAVDDRRCRFEGMHPALQRGRARSLSPRSRGHARHGDVATVPRISRPRPATIGARGGLQRRRPRKEEASKGGGAKASRTAGAVITADTSGVSWVFRGKIGKVTGNPEPP